MSIGPANPEGGDRSPARMTSLFPREGFGKQGDGAFRPVDVGSGLVNMQVQIAPFAADCDPSTRRQAR
jgi:hypothetical protein